MENKYIGGLVAIVVVIVVMASMFPLILGTQSNFTETKFYNEKGPTFREMHNGDVLIVDRTITDAGNVEVWTLNGKDISNSVVSWDVVIFSDALYVSTNAPSNGAIGTFCFSDQYAFTSMIGTGVSWSRYYFEMNDNNISAYAESSTSDKTLLGSASVTWAFVVCPVNEGAYMMSHRSEQDGICYINEDSDIFLCGLYRTGDLDTFYAYADGTLKVGATNITGIVDFDKELIDGTTDVYNLNVSVQMSSGEVVETFTPYFFLIPYEVVGHVESNAASDLVGLIPLLLIVSLLLMAVGLIVRSRF